MAKGNPILGTLGGSIGDLTLYRSRGQQISRARIRKIGNPRSEKQQLQRAILATNSQFYSRFSEILNNSLQSQTSPWATQAALAKYNLSLLRTLAASGTAQLVPKGLNIIAPNDYVVSRGTLPGIPVDSSEIGRAALEEEGFIPVAYQYIPLSDDYAVNASFTASQLFPTISVGDQVTVMAYITHADDSTPFTEVQYCRFAFANDYLPALIAVNDSQNVGNRVLALNPEAIDITKAAGPWRNLRFMWGGVYTGGNPAYEDFAGLYFAGGIGDTSDLISGASIIVSREEGRLRSNADMISSSRRDNIFNMDNSVPTYGDAGTPVDMPSEVYLNNDAQSTNSSAVLGIDFNSQSVTLPLDLVISTGASRSQSFVIYSRNTNLVNFNNATIEFTFNTGEENVSVTLGNTDDTAQVGNLTLNMDERLAESSELYLSAAAAVGSVMSYRLVSVEVSTPTGDIYPVV